jgi:hypothetical protein
LTCFDLAIDPAWAAVPCRIVAVRFVDRYIGHERPSRGPASGGNSARNEPSPAATPPAARHPACPLRGGDFGGRAHGWTPRRRTRLRTTCFMGRRQGVRLLSLPAPMLPSSAGNIREAAAGGGRRGGGQTGASSFVGRDHAVRIRSPPSPPPEPLTAVQYRLRAEYRAAAWFAICSMRAFTLSSASFAAGVDSSSGLVGRR